MKHPTDSFQFLIRNIDAGVRQTGSGTSGPLNFNISISLKNDNPPVQVVDRVFQVVQNSERAITENDLWYIDPDIDFDDRNLVISRRGIDNGKKKLKTEDSSADFFCDFHFFFL